jgi:hypothetical protein
VAGNVSCGARFTGCLVHQQEARRPGFGSRMSRAVEKIPAKPFFDVGRGTVPRDRASARGTGLTEQAIAGLVKGHLLVGKRRFFSQRQHQPFLMFSGLISIF